MNALDKLAYAILVIVTLAGAALVVMGAFKEYDSFLITSGILVLLVVSGWAICRVSE